MTIPTLLGTGGHQSSNQTYDSANYYSNVGLGRCAMNSGAVTTESNASRPIRAAGRISYLSWGVEDDGGFDADLTLTVKKGLSASVLSISIGAHTTGWVTDTTHSISVSSGDVLDFSTHLSGEATFSGSFYCVSARFDASTESAQMLTAFGPTDIAPLTTRKFVNLREFSTAGRTSKPTTSFIVLSPAPGRTWPATLRATRSTGAQWLPIGSMAAMARCLFRLLRASPDIMKTHPIAIL